MSDVLLITGGASGFGATLAPLAAARGWAVAVNYRSRRDQANAVVEAITRAGGRAGAIVNVSPMAATIGGRPGKSHYAASKAAVDAFAVGFVIGRTTA